MGTIRPRISPVRFMLFAAIVVLLCMLAQALT